MAFENGLPKFDVKEITNSADLADLIDAIKGNSVNKGMLNPKSDFMSMDNFFGGDGYTGWGGAALGTADALFKGWNAYQTNQIAKDNLDFQKNAFSQQFDTQRKMTNRQIADRESARSAATGKPVDAAYLAKWSV